MDSHSSRVVHVDKNTMDTHTSALKMAPKTMKKMKRTTLKMEQVRLVATSRITTGNRCPRDSWMTSSFQWTTLTFQLTPVKICSLQLTRWWEAATTIKVASSTSNLSLWTVNTKSEISVKDMAPSQSCRVQLSFATASWLTSESHMSLLISSATKMTTRIPTTWMEGLFHINLSWRSSRHIILKTQTSCKFTSIWNILTILNFRICQNEQQELVIGRSPNCDIRIDDQLISKMQSSIKYEDGNWILEDGRDGKESTNGTWYYLN